MSTDDIIAVLAREIVALHGPGADAEAIGDYVWEPDREPADQAALIAKIQAAINHGVASVSAPLTDEQIDEISKRPIDHDSGGIWRTALDRRTLIGEIKRQAELLDRVEVRLAYWRHIHNRAEAAAEMRAELDREVVL